MKMELPVFGASEREMEQFLINYERRRRRSNFFMLSFCIHRYNDTPRDCLNWDLQRICSRRGGKGRESARSGAESPGSPAEGGEAIKFTTASTFNAAMNLNFVKGNFSTATTAT